jgi:hypothetical protein
MGIDAQPTSSRELLFASLVATMMATSLRGHEAVFGLLTAIRKAKTNARRQVQIGGLALRIDARQLGRPARRSDIYFCAIGTQSCFGTSKLRSALQAHASSKFTIRDGDAVPFTRQHMANLIAANRTTVSLATSRCGVSVS